ncbi:hypothetical protein P4U43_11580 [Arthrobacter sp. EH-1B-1]|uniref:PDZ domain-containing protein n=1 Tax=Arthrobacter vasquezii TaxID=2977629 RepID=A0ABT6CZI1_9MICC|nr:hypothetical protein [Arthrobacter vasquezii]MDF9278429.1 hypothetical protein [Arthrobacter vasquezii]
MAQREFGGYAVMVIGAGKGSSAGVAPGMEQLELEQKLGKYLGQSGPVWELERLWVEGDREVLFIVVDPPKNGDPIHVCRGEFQGGNPSGSVKDGDVLIRKNGRTTLASSADIDALANRLKHSNRERPDFTVHVNNASSYEVSDEEVEQFLDTFVERARRRSVPKGSTRNFVLGGLTIPGTFVEQQTMDHFDREVDGWRRLAEETNADDAIDKLAGAFLPAAHVSVGNAVVGHVEGLAVTVTITNAYAVDWADAGSLNWSNILPPVARQWGIPVSPSIDYRTARHYYELEWSTTDSEVILRIELDSLPPEEIWRSDGDDFVLLALDPEAESLTASWRATARGFDTVFSGDFQIPVQCRNHLTTILERLPRS